MNDPRERFHHYDRNGNPTSVFDYEVCDFLTDDRLIVCGGAPFIYDKGLFRPDPQGARLKSLIRDCLFPRFVKSTTIDRIYRLIVSTYKIQKEPADLNDYPVAWVPFRNCFYDPVNKREIGHAPKYLNTVQLPHSYDGLSSVKGDRIEAWLQFAVPDPSDREMLLQFCGLCLTRDTHAQKFLVICGQPASGKSTLIRLIESMVGAENACHIPLQHLSQRFASYGLFRKLLNTSADLPVAALEDSGLVKQAVGEDMIRAEQKGKDAIDFRTVAKMVFSCNELPLILNEKTDGFFRRLLILRMDNVPTERNPRLFEDLTEELPYLIRLSLEALERYYASGTIHESENSIRAVRQLWRDSDTVQAWADECTEKNMEKRTDRRHLYQNYCAFCAENDRTRLQRNSFFRALRTKGYTEMTSCGTRYFVGIEIVKFI